jgi:hypothetical protein
MGSSLSGVLRGSALELRICVLRADPLAAQSDSVLVTPPALHLQQSLDHLFVGHVGESCERPEGGFEPPRYCYRRIKIPWPQGRPSSSLGSGTSVFSKLASVDVLVASHVKTALVYLRWDG